MLRNLCTKFKEQVNLFVLMNYLYGQGTLHYFAENFIKVKSSENIDDLMRISFVYFISRLYILFHIRHQFVLENIFVLQECTFTFT